MQADDSGQRSVCPQEGVEQAVKGVPGFDVVEGGAELSCGCDIARHGRILSGGAMNEGVGVAGDPGNSAGAQILQRKVISDHPRGESSIPVRALYDVPEAMTLLSLSRTQIYELIRSRRLVTVTQGRRRLVPADSISEYVQLLLREAGGDDGRAA
jgi:excisionase family DNA binding protein